MGQNYSHEICPQYLFLYEIKRLIWIIHLPQFLSHKMCVSAINVTPSIWMIYKRGVEEYFSSHILPSPGISFWSKYHKKHRGIIIDIGRDSWHGVHK